MTWIPIENPSIVLYYVDQAIRYVIIFDTLKLIHNDTNFIFYKLVEEQMNLSIVT